MGSHVGNLNGLILGIFVVLFKFLFGVSLREFFGSYLGRKRGLF